MQKVKLRKVGGSTTVAIPPNILASLSLSAGAEVQIEVVKGRVVLQPIMQGEKPTLADLLAQCDLTTPRTLAEQAEIDIWDKMPAVGREFGSPDRDAKPTRRKS
jgi:antitoxin ChpS